MSVWRFDVYQPVRQDVYDDKDILWIFLAAAWGYKLDEDSGERLPGPLYIHEVGLGSIAGTVLFDEMSLTHTAALFKISGPAIPPGG